MGKARLEAFSDGVFAIIITIMVLELKAPHEPELAALRPLLPVFGSYVFSFIIIGIYWNSHHNLLHAVERIDGRVLWHNLHVLFWLSLMPLATAWLGEYPLGPGPTAFYGLLLTMAAVAFRLLLDALIRVDGSNGHLHRSVGRDRKGRISLALALIGTVTAAFSPWLAHAFYWAVALIWFVPDPRMTRAERAEGR